MKKLIANVIDSYWSINQFDWWIDGLIKQSYCWFDRKNWTINFWCDDWFIYLLNSDISAHQLSGRSFFFKCMFNFIKPAMTKNAIWCSAVSFISNNLGFIWIFYNNVFWVKIHVAIKQNAGHIIRCLCGIVSFLYIWLSSYVN